MVAIVMKSMMLLLLQQLVPAAAVIVAQAVIKDQFLKVMVCVFVIVVVYKTHNQKCYNRSR